MAKASKTDRDGHVWIEMAPHKGDKDYAVKQCEAANKVLRKLYGPRTEFKFWAGGHKGLAYNLETSRAGTYIECVDNGHWFYVAELAEPLTLDERKELLAAANQTSREFLEIANGERKVGKVSVEPIVRLVQYARTHTIHPAALKVED